MLLILSTYCSPKNLILVREYVVNSMSKSKQAFVGKTLPEQMPQYLFPQAKKKQKKKTFSRQIFEIDFALEQVAVHGKIHRHHHHHWL